LRGALTLPIYDLLKNSRKSASNPESKDYSSQFWRIVGPSAISSILISALLYPLDTVKRC
jgi:hypothetical protein